MNFINLRLSLRLLKSNMLPGMLSIMVLTLGMASFMLVFFYIDYEKSYDKSWSKSGLIYRIALEKTLANGNATTTATNFGGLCSVIADEVPGIEYSTGIQRDIVTAYTKDNFFKNANFFWCDTMFFKVFDQQFLSGDKANPFPTMQSAVISESAALALFGSKDPVNERFKVNEGWEFIVSGVFADIPENSHLKIDILSTRISLRFFLKNFDNSTSTLKTGPVTGVAEPAPSARWLWDNPNIYTYVRLKDNVKTESVMAAFHGIYQKYTSHLIAAGQKSKFILQPVKKIHLDSHYDNELSMNSDRRSILTLYIIAILTLTMSWIVFINFQITQSIDRAKEFGLRKVAGATGVSLFSQIILQSLIIYSAGLVLAFLVFFLLRGQLSDYLQLRNRIPFSTGSLLKFVFLFLSGAMLSSIYPAFILISKSANRLLSEKFIQIQDGFNLRRSLVVFQFTASIWLMIATSVIIRQILFMKNKEIGITINQTVFSYTPMSMIFKAGATQKLVTFLEEINRMPGVISSTVSSCIPGHEVNFHSNTIYPMGKPENKGDNFGILNIDYNFQNVFEPRVLAGRMFSREDKPGGPNLLINRDACRKFGFDTPEEAIGEFVKVRVADYLSIPETPYIICGVVEDFHMESPRKKIMPLLMTYSYKWKYEVGFITVRFEHYGNDQEIFAILKKKWDSFFPSDPFEFQYTSHIYQRQMRSDEKLAGLAVIYTILSILLATVGLYGLAANSVRKRVKEIGIRKVFGARIPEVIVMLNRDFMKWIAVAFFMATPLAWFAMDKWLINFAYKTNLSWWVFALSGLLALAISLLTVSWHSWKAAARNPVDALRYE